MSSLVRKRALSSSASLCGGDLSNVTSLVPAWNAGNFSTCDTRTASSTPATVISFYLRGRRNKRGRPWGCRLILIHHPDAELLAVGADLGMVHVEHLGRQGVEVAGRLCAHPVLRDVLAVPQPRHRDRHL